MCILLGTPKIFNKFFTGYQIDSYTGGHSRISSRTFESHLRWGKLFSHGGSIWHNIQCISLESPGKLHFAMYSFFAVVVSCWILYVDDPFFIFPEKVDCLMASVSCILAQVLNIPFSWRKHEFGPQVTWIGWQFHVTAGYISLHQNRIVKLSTDISFMQKSSKTSKKSLEKTVGLLN